jgi:probable HAF family extracellular repeat protein
MLEKRDWLFSCWLNGSIIGSVWFQGTAGSLAGDMRILWSSGSFLAAILFATSSVPALAHDACDHRYRLADLGDLGGGYSFTEGMNDRGQIVGYSINSDGEPHGYIWSPGRGMRDLTPRSTFSVAWKINDRGQVVLNRTQASGKHQAILWSPSGKRVQVLPTLGGENTSAKGINNRAQVVGFSDLPNGDQHAFVWSPGDAALEDLGTLGSTHSAASAINELGRVVGHSNVSTGPENAFIWSPVTGTMRGLPTPGKAFSDATDINERGDIVGRVDGVAASQAVLWSRRTGRRQNLGTLGGSSGYARGINNKRQVVGESTTPPPEPGFFDGPQHAFLWSPGCGMQDLNDLVLRNIGVVLTFASAINDRGQIAADGERGNVTRAFLLTPVGEEGEAHEEHDGLERPEQLKE